MPKSNKHSGKKNNKDSIWLSGIPRKPLEVHPMCADIPVKYLKSVIKYCQGEIDTYTTIVGTDVDAATDSSGNIAQVFTNNPSGLSNWTALATVFDEYRVLGIELKFKPILFNGNLVNQAPIVTVNDYDSNAALTGYTLAAQYSSFQESAGGKPYVKYITMSGIENSVFTSTGSPSPTFYMKLWSSGNTPSIKIGRYTLKFILQFRGKGI